MTSAILSLLISTTMPRTAAPFAETGRELLLGLERDFHLADRRLYAESWPGDQNRMAAYNWSAGVVLSALAAAAEADPEFTPRLKSYAEAMETYWNPKPPIPGFDVQPNMTTIDRYYDDNAWVVMAYVEAFEVTKDPRMLGNAKRALTYVLSGEDDKLGGGIYWRESDRASKNTCSNGPAVAAILAVYRHEPDPELLRTAVRIYGWTKKNLMDPSDNLMWDNLTLDGKLEKTKWSYNTALMLRSALGLAEVTKDPNYRQDAHAFAKASVKHWVDEDAGTIKCEGRFAHLLFENLVAYEKATGVNLFDAPALLRKIVQNLKDPNGHYASRWDRPTKEPLAKVESIDQASVVRAVWVMARETQR